MMPKVKATNTFKIQSILKKFPEERTKSRINELYRNLCNCTVSCGKSFVVDSNRKTS